MQTKYVFVTGGVASSLGKGIFFSISWCSPWTGNVISVFAKCLGMVLGKFGVEGFVRHGAKLIRGSRHYRITGTAKYLVSNEEAGIIFRGYYGTNEYNIHFEEYNVAPPLVSPTSPIAHFTILIGLVFENGRPWTFVLSGLNNIIPFDLKSISNPGASKEPE